MSPSERVDLVPVETTWATPTCPSWLLLLDDPAPHTVVMVGPPDDGIVAWFASVGVTVELCTRPEVHRSSGTPVDLLILTSDVRLGRHVTGATDLLDRSLRTADPGAVVVGPTVAGPESNKVLDRHGFSIVRPIVPTGDGRSRQRGGGGSVAVRPAPDDETTGSAPPRWLVDLAGDAPWAPRHEGWTLRVPETHPSQEAVVVCRRAATDEPTAIVRITRHTRFNTRLDNEARSLRRVASSPAAALRAPTVLTDGRVAGLSFVAEAAVVGRPFSKASRFAPDCPLAADAVLAIGELARTEAQPLSGWPLADRLDAMLDRYVERFRSTSEDRRFLKRQIGVIDRSELPDVVFHGDLDPRNLVVNAGSVRILDWEAAEYPGPPLWDLAYFAHAFAVRSGRRRGLPRDRAIGRHLLDTSDLNAAMSGWFRCYAEQIGLEPHLVEPLFHTTWMHCAVKESNRLAPDTDGHYGPLCARLIEERQAPGLRRLLGR